MASLIGALLVACTLDAIEGADCTRLPEGRNRADCWYASLRAVRTDIPQLDATLARIPEADRDGLLLRLAADVPEARNRVCARVSAPASQASCGSGTSLPR